MATNKLCLAWSGDLESLKELLCEKYKLNGTWSHPGGDKKVFTFGDSSISWRRNKHLLYFDGSKANLIKKELCKQMCEDGEDNLELAEVHVSDAASSCKSNDFSVDMESLKSGQSVNGDAIRSLSENIVYLTSIMSQFQDYIEKNNACERESSMRKLLDMNVNTANSNYAFFNEDKDNSIVMHEQINLNDNLIVMHEQINLNDSNQANINQTISIAPDSPPTREPILTDVGQSASGIIDEQSRPRRTYAQVAKSPPPVNEKGEINEINGRPSTDDNVENTMQVSAARKMVNEQTDVSADGFIGVQRKRSRIKKFFLSRIGENVKDQDILSYLEKRKVTPTYLSLFKSKRKGSISAKLHVPANACSLIENKTFWPKFVQCKLWKPKSSGGKTNSTQEGILSTYV